MTPVVIGRSANPRCFSQVKRERLGVSYEANTKAWMTGEIFTRWLRRFNNQMVLQSRHVLLFLDNCGAHPSIKLSNVRLAFLPPNTTSRLQPMDAGVIQAMKLGYRKLMMGHIATRIDEVSTASELARSITVLNAIQWVKASWDLVKTSTIHKCFIKCGFGADVPAADVPAAAAVVNNAAVHVAAADREIWEDDDLLPLLRLVPGATAKDFVDMDEATSVCYTDVPTEPTTLRLELSSDEEDEVEPTPPPSYKRAHLMMEELVSFALHHNSSSILSMAQSIKHEIQTMCLSDSSQLRQSVIKDFFTP